jgi:hypothetical protein
LLLLSDDTQVHGGTEEEGWAALEAARAAIKGQLAETLRKRIAAGREEPLSEEEIRERAEAAYNDPSVKDKVLGRRFTLVAM